MQIRNLFVAIACMAVIGFVAEQSQAQGPNNLFSQYYTQGAGQVHAEMYPAPHPVPRNVGGAYYTYQPLMPHEHMYAHSRDYYNYYATPASFYGGQCNRSRGGYGYTKTSVRWQSGCNAVAPLPGNWTPANKLQHWFGRQKGVADGPINNLLSCTHGGCGLGNRLGTSRGGGLPGGYGGCTDCANDGAEFGYDSGCSDGTCGSWEEYAARMEQARREAAARTAHTMQTRYSR